MQRHLKPPMAVFVAGAMVLVFLVAHFVHVRFGVDAWVYGFAMGPDWPQRPWVLAVSTLTHLNLGHLVTNVVLLALWVTMVDRVVRPNVWLPAAMVVAAVASVVQVAINPLPTVGASAAVTFLIGLFVPLPSKPPGGTELPYGFVWVLRGLGVAYFLVELLAIVGVLTLSSGSGVVFGHAAHMLGYAVGAAAGSASHLLARHVYRRGHVDRLVAQALAFSDADSSQDD